MPVVARRAKSESPRCYPDPLSLTKAERLRQDAYGTRRPCRNVSTTGLICSGDPYTVSVLHRNIGTGCGPDSRQDAHRLGIHARIAAEHHVVGIGPDDREFEFRHGIERNAAVVLQQDNGLLGRGAGQLDVALRIRFANRASCVDERVFEQPCLELQRED